MGQLPRAPTTAWIVCAAATAANNIKMSPTCSMGALVVVLLVTVTSTASAFQNEGCTDATCGGHTASRFSMPLTSLGAKKYYLGIFFKANWYKAEQYCRFHGMHLASINSDGEQRNLEEHIQSFGMGHEHFWTSGTDQGEESKFFWMSTGKPMTYENWNAGEPNNFQYENGEQEHCLELWNRDGKGLRWNDTPCSFETFFVCEV